MIKMKLADVTQLSSENWLALMPVLFKRRGYDLEGCMLWLKGKKARHLAFCLPTLSTLSVDDLGKCIPTGVQSGATFSYVVTQGKFCPEVKVAVLPWEKELVDGAELHKWLCSARLL
jgi:hypothetical protein